MSILVLKNKRLIVMAIACSFSLCIYGKEKELQQDLREGIPIRPSTTDSSITSFDSPHWIHLNQDIVISKKAGLPTDRHQLLLWLPGTGKDTERSVEKKEKTVQFKQVAADLGYHVIVLQYPNDTAAAEVCNNVKNPRAFEQFRMSIIEGAASKYVKISRVNSIENRLIKLLVYLGQTRPQEHWDEFLYADCTIKWELIAVGGQSQGGGHAALLGIKHRVARVICSGAPKDYNHVLERPAAWYHSPSATPKKCFFAFNHHQDAMGGCSPEQQIENLKALGLQRFGDLIDVDAENPPYRHSRMLTSNYPGRQIESLAAHVQFFRDRYKETWNYMLTEE